MPNLPLEHICAVHPHACGEHSAYANQILFNTGSSPRMWGTHSIPGFDDVIYRFIPTHVGNTSHTESVPLLTPVHPHACGEHNKQVSIIKKGIGSSPRMWGTLFEDFAHSTKRRFIPTHVGNTSTTETAASHRSVHPHACGEHS